MNAIQLVNAEIGTVSSREDGSVAFRVITAELRPSEKGLVMDYHGKACKVTIQQHEGTPDEFVTVDTERGVKTPSQRLRALLFLCWKNTGSEGDFDSYYVKRMAKICDFLKLELDKS